MGEKTHIIGKKITMDILAHGLWTAAAYKGLNKKRGEKEKFSVSWATFWGIFPDLFAFALPWVFILIGIVSGAIHLSSIPGPDSIEPPRAEAFPMSIFNLASSLYNISHSAVVFGAVMFAVWAIRKKVPWEMGGWILHILIDIPTHSYGYFPTPVFWPISGWKFSHGISWHLPWFMVLNYSALLVTYIILLYGNKKNHTASSYSNHNAKHDARE